MFHHESYDLANLDSPSLCKSTCHALPSRGLGPFLCPVDTI